VFIFTCVDFGVEIYNEKGYVIPVTLNFGSPFIFVHHNKKGAKRQNIWINLNLNLCPLYIKIWGKQNNSQIFQNGNIINIWIIYVIQSSIIIMLCVSGYFHAIKYYPIF